MPCPPKGFVRRGLVKDAEHGYTVSGERTGAELEMLLGPWHLKVHFKGARLQVCEPGHGP